MPADRREGPMLKRLARRMFKGVAVLAMGGVLALAALVGALWLEHRRAITLPPPTGPFAVGRITDAWVDDAPDTLAPAPGTKRELVVRMWYPSAPGQSPAMMDDYLPPRERAEIERARGRLISNLLTRDLSKVVIMRPGASAEVANYSTLAEDLASHGYVVVGFDAPYRTNLVVFPDGRVIRRTPENNPELCLRPNQDLAQCVNRLLAAWSANIAFVLDRLERLNRWSTISRAEWFDLPC